MAAIIQKMADLAAGVRNAEQWPPPEHEQRLANYELYTKLMDGDHVNAFPERTELDRYGVYLTANLPALICKSSTDMLMGEDITLEFDEKEADEKSSEIEFVQELWEKGNLQQIFYEGALDASPLGDDVYQVVRDEEGRGRIENGAPRGWVPAVELTNI